MVPCGRGGKHGKWACDFPKVIFARYLHPADMLQCFEDARTICVVAINSFQVLEGAH